MNPVFVRKVVRIVAALLVTFCLIVTFPVLDYIFSQKSLSTKEVSSNISLEEISFKKPEQKKPQRLRAPASKPDRPTPSKLTADSSRFKMEFGTGEGSGAAIGQEKIQGIVYKEGQVDKDAVLRSSILPVYPEGAQSAGISGYVVLVVVIDEKGDVIGITVEESTTGYGFKEVCVEAVQQWKFAPATLKGIPVKFQYRIPFRF